MSKASSSKKDTKPPPAKRSKVETPKADESSINDGDSGDYVAAIGLKRVQCAKSILDFKFNKKRCRLLSKSMDIGDNGGGILYWMSREQRVQGIYINHKNI